MTNKKKRKKNFFFIVLIILFLLPKSSFAEANTKIELPIPSSKKMDALLNSIQKTSLLEFITLHELYPHTPQGKRAFNKALSLVKATSPFDKFDVNSTLKTTSPHSLYHFFDLSNKKPLEDLDPTYLNLLTKHLPNRQLKGYSISTEEELLKLKPEEIDLTRALFISQQQNPSLLTQLHPYESLIDSMAIQILIKLNGDQIPEAIIKEINYLIFEKLHFTFPPQSIYAKDIDFYTFLPSVLDSRKGVCLGISTLYLCLAQRLNLPLEIFTPPGHIFIGYENKRKKIIRNIETTARGIHIPSEEYLGINTRYLQKSSLKDVVGLSFFNQASVFLKKEDYSSAIASYEKALLYLENDPLIFEYMGYAHFIQGNLKEAFSLFEKIKDHIPDYAISNQNAIKDILDKKIDASGIKIMLMEVDESLESILNKKQALLSSLKEFPKFQMGWFSLAISWLQLNRQVEALEALKKYHALQSSDPTAEYYLASLYLERYDYSNSWKHLKHAELLTLQRDKLKDRPQNNLKHRPRYQPQALKDIRKKLEHFSPE